jgi:hypothetical protein
MINIRQATLYQKIPLVAYLRRMSTTTRTASLKSQVRVAERWVIGSFGDIDLVARLQVLEGVTGTSLWTWAKNPKAGLAKARAYFAEMDLPLDPEWLSGGDTGMVLAMERNAAKILTSVGGRGLAAEDLVINVIMGLSSSGAVYDKQALWSLGKTFSRAILSGAETPLRFGRGVASKQVVDRAKDEVRKNKTRNVGRPVRDDEDTGQIEDPQGYLHNKADFEQFLWTTMGSKTPEGKALRALIVQAGSGNNPRIAEVAEAISDFFQSSSGWRSGEADNVALIKKSLAAKFGISREAINAMLSRVIIPKFQALLRRSPVYKALQDQYALL